MTACCLELRATLPFFISVRHAACNLSFLANASETSEVTYRKQLVVRTKKCSVLSFSQSFFPQLHLKRDTM